MNMNPITNYANSYEASQINPKKKEKTDAADNGDNPVLSTQEEENEKKNADGIHKSSPEDCQTCKNRKYQDGSDEGNVSFKAAAHISPDSAAARVRAHEGEHVSNAYKKAAQKNGKVVNASVSIHTSICPECGRVYVSGGTTNTTIKYSNESNPYQKDKKSLGSVFLRGDNLDYNV